MTALNEKDLREFIENLARDISVQLHTNLRDYVKEAVQCNEPDNIIVSWVERQVRKISTVESVITSIKAVKLDGGTVYVEDMQTMERCLTELILVLTSEDPALNDLKVMNNHMITTQNKLWLIINAVFRGVDNVTNIIDNAFQGYEELHQVSDV
jgi:hypothetical protein